MSCFKICNVLSHDRLTASVRESVFKAHTGKTRNPELNEVKLGQGHTESEGGADLNSTGAQPQATTMHIQTGRRA